MNKDIWILTAKRNDYGKLIRKQYESGLIVESRHLMTDIIPEDAVISHTITTVTKDNLIMEKTYRIKQATSLGYKCMRGGYAISVIQNQKLEEEG